jgi:hypothetical protein
LGGFLFHRRASSLFADISWHVWLFLLRFLLVSTRLYIVVALMGSGVVECGGLGFVRCLFVLVVCALWVSSHDLVEYRVGSISFFQFQLAQL